MQCTELWACFFFITRWADYLIIWTLLLQECLELTAHIVNVFHDSFPVVRWNAENIDITFLNNAHFYFLYQIIEMHDGVPQALFWELSCCQLFQLFDYLFSCYFYCYEISFQLPAGWNGGNDFGVLNFGHFCIVINLLSRCGVGRGWLIGRHAGGVSGDTGGAQDAGPPQQLLDHGRGAAHQGWVLVGCHAALPAIIGNCTDPGMWTAGRMGAICSSIATWRSCSTDRAPLALP
jgi:hypothetical protein